MTPAPTRGLEGQSLPAFGMQPSGMLRIRLGEQERYIWPVHLPGWLAAGWRVAEAAAQQSADGTGVLSPVGVIAEDAAPSPTAAAEPGDNPDVPPVSTRGRRGRRRKEEPSPDASDQAATESAGGNPQVPGTPDPIETNATADFSPDSGIGGTFGAGPELPADLPSQPGAESTAVLPNEPAAELDPEAPEVPVLTALPDDLFDDPLT